MRRVRVGLLVLVLAAAALGAVIIVNAMRYGSRQLPSVPAPAFVPLAGAVERLAAAVAIPTVSYADVTRRDTAAFARWREHLARSFPRAHATLRTERFERDAMLYTWPGLDTAAAPLVLLAHVDVVPVEPGTESQWTRPPFGGVADSLFVWGRGTQDDKAGALGILEAVEGLLASGFRPRRSIYVALGADEETGGLGARAIADSLRARRVRPAVVLDEGGAVVRGVMPGLSRPLAAVGVAEKGYATLRLEARGPGGHSSMPPRHTAVGRLARAIAILEGNPFPARLREPFATMLDRVGREMSFGMRVVFANRWLTEPLIRRQLTSNPTTDAALRTTTAVTMLEGSPKDNVLPQRARAAVNFRLMPGDSLRGVVDRTRNLIGDRDVVVTLDSASATEPSPVSPSSGATWEMLARTIRSVYPDAVVAPYLSLGGTDARWYSGLSENVYRFLPQRWEADDVQRMHGTNERIRVGAYGEQIRFYATLIRAFAGAAEGP